MTGKDIKVILSQSGTAIAATCIRSNDIRTKADMIEKASATQQEWKEYIAGRAEWTMNADFLVLSSSQMLDLLKVRQTFDITMTATDGQSSSSLVGKVILAAVDIKASTGSLAKGSFQFQGTGMLMQPQS